MKEKRLIEIGEWLNTQGFDLDLTDPFWMEDCRFGEHKVRDIAELLDDFCNQEVEKRIKERIDGFDVVYDFGEAHRNLHLKTQKLKWSGALWMFEWLRSRLIQKTEGGGE